MGERTIGHTSSARRGANRYQKTNNGTSIIQKVSIEQWLDLVEAEQTEFHAKTKEMLISIPKGAKITVALVDRRGYGIYARREHELFRYMGDGQWLKYNA